MALLFVESFDHAAAIADLGHTGRWDVTSRPGVVIDGAGRTDQCIRASDDDCWIARASGGGTELYFGFGYQPPSIAAGTKPFFALYDSAGTKVFTLARSGSGLDISGGSLTGASASGLLTAGAFHQIEIRCLLADASGRIVVRVNQQTVIDLTGDSKPGAAAAFGDYRLLGDSITSGDQDTRIDDFWICNTSGSVNNTFLGDSRVHCSFPEDSGASSQWVGSDGNSTDNYALIDEPATSDADYVQATVDGEKDLYVFQDVAALNSQTVRGVQHSVRAQYLNAGTPKDLTLIARSAAAVELDSSEVDLTNSLADYARVFETKPAGGAWTIDDINASQFGYKQSPN